MPRYKTAELSGALLRRAAAMALSYRVEREDPTLSSWVVWTPDGGVHSLSKRGWCPDLKWEYGGPLLDGYLIATAPVRAADGSIVWCAWVEEPDSLADEDLYFERYNDPSAPGRGPTPLIAAMRAFVASKLGEEVELP